MEVEDFEMRAYSRPRRRLYAHSRQWAAQGDDSRGRHEVVVFVCAVAVGQEPEEDALQGGEAKAALTLGQVKPEPGGGNSKPNVNGEAAPAPSISDESLSEGEEMRRAAEAARGLKRPRPVTVINLSDSEDEAKPAPPRQQSEGTVRAGPATGTMGGTTVPRYLPSLTREFQNDPNCPDFSRTEWAVREMWRDEKRRAAENTGNRQTPRQGTANNPLDL